MCGGGGGCAEKCIAYITFLATACARTLQKRSLLDQRYARSFLSDNLGEPTVKRTRPGMSDASAASALQQYARILDHFLAQIPARGESTRGATPPPSWIASGPAAYAGHWLCSPQFQAIHQPIGPMPQCPHNTFPFGRVKSRMALPDLELILLPPDRRNPVKRPAPAPH